ncbi:MAG TPA: saccharopine dehydrogenase NADP-binding domain-containing protein, partial [Bacteroidales bacterium]|nr:saccharopine dehydrogenase NADP-binding domain-containing protein [Bacteroidales bacterium]
MGKVLIIGAGGVGTVVAHKVAKEKDVFSEILLASRTKEKCDAIA